METKKAALAFLLVVFIASISLQVPVSAQIDCLDGCQTACVNRDPRLVARCDIKCQIRCGPDARAENLGGI